MNLVAVTLEVAVNPRLPGSTYGRQVILLGQVPRPADDVGSTPSSRACTTWRRRFDKPGQRRQVRRPVQPLAFGCQRPHHHRWVPRVIVFRNRYSIRVWLDRIGNPPFLSNPLQPLLLPRSTGYVYYHYANISWFEAKTMMIRLAMRTYLAHPLYMLPATG